MFELLTRIMLWALIGYILWYIFSTFIPKAYLTWLGGLILFAFIVLAFIDPLDRTSGAVWSILSLPLKPLGLTIFLLLSALREGTKKVVANQVVAALLILFFSSTPIVAYWLTSQTEQTAFDTVALQGDRQPNPATVKAIVVLGDGTSPSDPTYRARTQFNNEGQYGTGLTSRLLYAAQLHKEQTAQNNNPLVIVSAGPQPEQGQEDRTVVDLLTSMGVPEDRVLIDPISVNVRTSAVEADRLLQERGFVKGSDSVVLVAPALTIRRTSSAFAQLGLDVIPQPTDFFAFQVDDNVPQLAFLSDLIPNVEALALTTRVVEEYLSSIYYFLRGWLTNPMSF